MNYKELFLDFNKLPKPLTKEELYSYIKQYRQGDLNARDQVIIHNIRLVLYRVNKKYANTTYDKKELVAIGIVGLVNCVDNFDIERNIEFSTYATNCIDSEIFKYLRKIKKTANDISIYTPINIDKDGKEQKIEDVLKDYSSDLVSNYENKIIYDEIRKAIYNLPDNEREVILLYFGFIDNHTYTQKEIANKLGKPQCYVSRLVNKIVKQIGVQLQENDIIENVGCYKKKTKSIPTSFTKK